MRSLIMLMLLGMGTAYAGEEDEARRLFDDGKKAYENGQYQPAYQSFERAYLLLPRPELLFNMASTLEKLGRPHQAAEKLRAFLRVRPDAPDRDAVQERMLALEEQQRILDEKRPAALPPPSLPPAPPAKQPVYKKWWLWTVVGVVAAGAAVGLGVGLTQPKPAWSSVPDFGPGAH